MSGSRAIRPARDTGVGKAAVGGVGVGVLTLGFCGLSLLLLYSLFAFWPPSFAADVTTVPSTTAIFFGQTVSLDRERSLLVMVALAGATGAMAHVLRSFLRYAGERHLLWSWIPSYLLTPFVGALLATLTYMVLRAGLIPGGTSLGNPFGFAAIGTLVGLFSAQAAEKLKEVFETIFASAPAGSEAIGSAARPSIASFEPTSGGAGDDVAIRGTNLEGASQVVFGGGVAAIAAWDPDAGVLRTRVPTGAMSGPLSVTVGTATAASTDSFGVLARLVPLEPTLNGAGNGSPPPAPDPILAAQTLADAILPPAGSGKPGDLALAGQDGTPAEAASNH